MRTELSRTIYDEALDGLPLLGTPLEAATRHRQYALSAYDAAESLIRQYATLSGLTGFVCGLPGYMTMPVTIPTNIAGVLLLRAHLCAAVAVLGGRTPHDPSVREQCVACVLDLDRSPEGTRDELSGWASLIASKMGERGVRFVGEHAVYWLSRAGQGARSLPGLGGFVGGFFDAKTTGDVGRRAREVFL